MSRMNLQLVKSKIHKTECCELLCAGLYCSEPIMIKDKDGKLIDSYFTYSRSADLKKIGIPEVMFGIYSDIEKTAYIKQIDPSIFESDVYEESFVELNVIESSMKKYIALFPTVRKNIYREKVEECKDDLKEYIKCLEIISGKILYSFYKKLYPDFFEWIEHAIQ